MIPSNNYLIIIGAMKSGTSSLYDYLIKHPRICPCQIKEPEFFSKNQNRSIKVDNYEDLWEHDPKVHKFVIEASTGYTKYPHETGVPERIFNYGINPNFIYIVRNPFERILSHYNSFKHTPNFDLNIKLSNDRFVAVSNYYLQLHQFLKYFPNKQQYLILDFSELADNPKLVIDKVLDFLNLEKDSYDNRNYEVKNSTARLSKIEEFLFKSNLIQLSQLLPNNFKTKLKTFFRQKTPSSNQRSFSKEEYNEIYNQLRNDMVKFQKEFGIDVSRWGF